MSQNQWVGSTGTDAGILRNKTRGAGIESKPEELLVFGYACKIFRDDEKALHIDQGKHLIPWMGDESLRIDRYDGRGTLANLKQFEASKEGYDTTRWLGLSDSQRKLEELCDAERYYSLEINEEEEEMYKEEEAKRKLMSTAFQYSYNENGSAQTAPTPKEPEGIPTVPEFNEDEQPYIPSPLLDVPVDISIPSVIKEYARIEKTALFVCQQGQQMEILIKTKQSENPQFSFLNQTDSLYKFYRHVLAAFKNGRYRPQYNKQKDQDKPDGSQSEPDHHDDNHYLHPSLLSSKPAHEQNPPPPPVQMTAVPTLQYQPSADCTYSQLVTRIQGTAGPTAQPEPPPIVAVPVAPQVPVVQQLSPDQMQYYQFYYLQQYYDYYKQTLLAGPNGAQYGHLPQIFHQLDPAMQSFVHQLAFVQYVQHCQQQQHQQEIQVAPVPAQAQQGTNSYAQIVSNLNKDGINQYSANVPQLPVLEIQSRVEQPGKPNETKEAKSEIKEVVAAYGSGSDTEDEEAEESDANEEQKSVGKSSRSSASPEKEGGSDEEIDGKEIKSQPPLPEIKILPADVQVIIDKMADYVFKNGEQFEDIIRAKSDPRFGFLNTDHEFHGYYRKKLRELKGEPEPQPVTPPQTKETVKKEKKPKTKPKKVVAPVSFSIKKSKEEPQKEIKSALPVEDSTDEEGNGEEKSKEDANENNANTGQSKLPDTIYNIHDQSGTQKLSHMLEASVALKEKGSTKVNGKSTPDSQKRTSDSDKEISDSGDSKEKRGAEDKLKDKLAAVAREKLASVTREKALQLERKRKAAAFLKLKAQNDNTVAVATSDPSSLSSLLLSNVKSAKVRKVSDLKKPAEGSEPIFDDIPPKSKKRAVKEKESADGEDPGNNETNQDVEDRLENKLDTSTTTVEKSSSDSESSSDDCEIVSVSYPKKIKKRARSRTRSKSKSRSRSRSKEKKKRKEKKVKRSRSSNEPDKSKRKKEKKKKSHKKKHGKSSHESRHKKKSKKQYRSRSKSAEKRVPASRSRSNSPVKRHKSRSRSESSVDSTNISS